MSALHRLFGGTHNRDWSGWSLEATTKIVITVELEGPFAGEPLVMEPLSPADAATAIERLTGTGARISVRTQHELVPFRDVNGTAIFVDDMTPRERDRITAEMLRAGVPIVARGVATQGETEVARPSPAVAAQVAI